MVGYVFIISSFIGLGFLIYSVTHLELLNITLKHPKIIVECGLFFIFLIAGTILLNGA